MSPQEKSVKADPLAVIVLAAGKGTRMKSELVKVLHPLLGRPMLAHILDAAGGLSPVRTAVVVGHQAERVEAAFPGTDLTFVLQEEQLGTGHAVGMCRDALSDFVGTVLILCGDVPLLTRETLTFLLKTHTEKSAVLSVLTVRLPDPGAYGRVIRDNGGQLSRIVEARDATPEELAVDEINSGIYVVDSGFLFNAVECLRPENDQKEYYLTDVVGIARSWGLKVIPVPCSNPEEVAGINDRVQLARAAAIMRERVNREWMRSGVTMVDPMATYIDTTVTLAADVVLWPGTCLSGKTSIGAGAIIGPNCQITDSVIGNHARVPAGSVLREVDFFGDAEVSGTTVPGRPE